MNAKLYISLGGQANFIISEGNNIVAINSYPIEKSLDTAYKCCKQLGINSIVFILDNMYVSNANDTVAIKFDVSSNITGCASVQDINKMIKIADSLHMQTINFVDRVSIIKTIKDDSIIVDAIDGIYKIIVYSSDIKEIKYSNKNNVLKDIQLIKVKTGINNVIDFNDIIFMQSDQVFHNINLINEDAMPVASLASFAEYCLLNNVSGVTKSMSVREMAALVDSLITSPKVTDDLFLDVDENVEIKQENTVLEGSKKRNSKKSNSKKKKPKTADTEDLEQEEFDNPNKRSKKKRFFSNFLITTGILTLLANGAAYAANYYFTSSWDTFQEGFDVVKSNLLGLQSYSESLNSFKDDSTVGLLENVNSIIDKVGVKNVVNLEAKKDNNISLEFKAKNKTDALRLVRGFDSLNPISAPVQKAGTKDVFIVHLQENSL